MEQDDFIPDPRARIHYLSSVPSFDNPSETQAEILEALDSGEIDQHTFLYISLPLLQRIELPIPGCVSTIAGALQSDVFSEEESRIIILTLTNTGSYKNYSTEIEEACTRFPNLRSLIQ